MSFHCPTAHTCCTFSLENFKFPISDWKAISFHSTIRDSVLRALSIVRTIQLCITECRLKFSTGITELFIVSDRGAECDKHIAHHISVSGTHFDLINFTILWSLLLLLLLWVRWTDRILRNTLHSHNSRNEYYYYSFVSCPSCPPRNQMMQRRSCAKHVTSVLLITFDVQTIRHIPAFQLRQNSRSECWLKSNRLSLSRPFNIWTCTCCDDTLTV